MEKCLKSLQKVSLRGSRKRCAYLRATVVRMGSRGFSSSLDSKAPASTNPIELSSRLPVKSLPSTSVGSFNVPTLPLPPPALQISTWKTPNVQLRRSLSNEPDSKGPGIRKSLKFNVRNVELWSERRRGERVQSLRARARIPISARMPCLAK